MQCKQHPDRKAEHFCASCRIPLCSECGEESKSGAYFCFKCAMDNSVSQVGASIKDKKEKSAEKKEKEKKKKKWGPFQYFVIVTSVLIVFMWGFILFGGKERPSNRVDFDSQQRVLIFMVDAAIKRYAHYEENKYPERLKNLVPGYLNLAESDLHHLGKLSYQKDPKSGYRLSFAEPKDAQMDITLTSEGIEYKPSSDKGA